MSTYIVIYSHRHGVNTGLVKCEREPTNKEMIDAFPNWDFELHREDEFLEVEKANEPIFIP